MPPSRARLPGRYYRAYPASGPQGEATRAVELDLDHTGLLLVDVYHKAAQPAGASLVPAGWEQAWWRTVREALGPTLAAARAAGLPVIYVMNSAPRIELARSPFGRVHAASRGFQLEEHFRERDVDPREYACGDPVQLLIPEVIAPQPADYYVRKHVYSGFFETRLHSLLTNLNLRTLLCAGFAANACLLFTMGDAVFRGYEVVLLRDCTLAAEDPSETGFAETERSVRWVESFLGASALSADLITALQAAQPAGGQPLAAR
jgi:nicotinamidase-related amidase